MRDAERIGLGSVFLSERFNVKEASTLCGAAAAASEEIGIATGVTNHPTRHPIITAAHTTTMHKLTRGRYALGLGRGIAPLTTALGIPPITMRQMEDAIGLYRRLWRGETILGHDGPAGRWPFLRLDPSFDEDIPVMVSALGLKTMAWAGGVADGVILHTFFSDDALARCVEAIRGGAERAGQDPARVRIWSCVATLCEPDHERRMRDMVGRMATYLQAYPDPLVAINDWDPAVVERFRADPVVGSMLGAIDQLATLEQLEHIATLIPEEWLPCAIGTAEECAATVRRQLELGCDGVIMHASTPAQLEPVVVAYRRVRDAERFADREANPGR